MSELVGITFSGGRYRVERHLQGTGLQQLLAGRDAATGGEVFISYDKLPKRLTIEQFVDTTGEAGEGVAALLFAGRPDDRDHVHYWGVIERADGRWLPSLIGQHPADSVDDWTPRPLPSHNAATALPNALALGISASHLLASAAERGRVYARVRPETMWATRGSDDLLRVTTVSDRTAIMFGASYTDAFVSPVFDRQFHAPEVERGDADERSIVFCVAIMIAEWATGSFPYATRYHPNGPLKGKHTPLAVPERLANLLSRGMRLDPAQRPALRSFVEQLERI